MPLEFWLVFAGGSLIVLMAFLSERSWFWEWALGDDPRSCRAPAVLCVVGFVCGAGLTLVAWGAWLDSRVHGWSWF